MQRGPDSSVTSAVPFDTGRLDRLMEEAGIDVLLVTSKHNTRYLLGGYRFIFFAAMDAIGHSRYLPIVIYEKGRPENACYVGNRMEAGEHQNRPFWTPAFHPACWGTLDAAGVAVEHLFKLGRAAARIGIEPAFLPADAHRLLIERLAGARLMDATGLAGRIIAHEVPFLMTNHPVAYEGVDAARPLEAGMVLSVETTMLHPTRGFIKLEDTLAVTREGYEMFGNRGRGWNRGGITARA